MRVINRPGRAEVWPKTIMCPHCGCEIEYDEYDLEDVEGGIGFACPDCSNTVITQEIELHKFPNSFHHVCKGKNVVCLSDEEVQAMVDRIVKYLENAEIGEHFFTGTGDTIVFGFKLEDESAIYVCTNYWEECYDFRD